MQENPGARWCLKDKAMSVHSNPSKSEMNCQGIENRNLITSFSYRKMSSPWIYLAGILLLLLHISTSVTSEQVLVWSQHSHKWTKLRGLFGETDWQSQSRKRFVTSESSRDKVFNSLGYDHKTRYLYWHDSTTKAIYRQHVNDSLVMRRDDNIELVYDGTSGVVKGLAVDWIGGNVIWADKNKETILMATRKNKGTQVSRVVMTNVVEPVGLAVDPVAGLIYWGTNDFLSTKIESCTFNGEGRMTLAQNPDVSNMQCLNLDRSENALYFIQVFNEVYLSKMNLGDRQITNVRPLSGSRYAAVASHGDYIYLLYADNLELKVLNKRGQDVYNHVIDAIPHDIVVTDPLFPIDPPDDCVRLDCGDFCISKGMSDGDSTRVMTECRCRDKYYFEMDERTCASSMPRYIYSVDGDLVNLVAELPMPYTNGEAQLTQIASDYSRIEAIGYNFIQDQIYFSDTLKEAIYRGAVDTEEDSFVEHTVNEYNVQGIAVCWLTDTVYWADADLRHIMLSQKDGRYHKVLLEDVGTPRGLTVDASHGYLFYAEDDEKAIKRANLDGTDLKTIAFGLVLPHAVVADPRNDRIYWADGTNVKSAALDGSDLKFVTMLNQMPFGITLWDQMLTWTESNTAPGFLRHTYNQPISMSYRPDNTHDFKIKTYAIVTYNDYLQPPLIGDCVKNGGCQQLCYPLPQGHSCGCAIGYTLDTDKKSCNTKVAENNYVLFMDPYHKALYQLDMDDSWTTNAVPIRNMDFPIAFDLDRSSGKIYWIDLIKKSIRSSFTNGLEERSVWRFQKGHKPMKLVHDHNSKTIFFLDDDKQALYKVGEDGQGLSEVVPNIARPSALAIDTEKRLIYFADLGMTPSESKISMVKTDGSRLTIIAQNDVRDPTALTLHEEDKVLYWCDGYSQMISVFDIESKSNILSFVIGTNGKNIISLAVDDKNIYYTTRDKKSVFKVSRNSSGTIVGEPLDKPIFARITDVKAYPGISLLPPPPIPVGGAEDFPVMWIGIAAAAAVLLALLFLLLAFCVARNKKKKKPQGAPHTNPEAAMSGFDHPEEEVEREFIGVDNPTIYAMKHNGHANGTADVDVMYVNVPNGHANGDTNGHVNPVVSSAPELREGFNDINEPPNDLANAAAMVVSTGALKKTKYDKKHNPRRDPNQFEMDGNKVATVIQRIANRLRTGLDSIRWNGDPDGRSSRGRSSLPPTDPTSDGEPNASDTHGGGKYAKNRPPLGPMKPQLHRLPQGFAPASRVTPSNVKATFGRIKKPT